MIKKYLFKRYLLSGILIIAFTTIPAYAGKNPRGTLSDARVKTLTYSDNEVYALRGHYGFSMVIEFSSKERIESISIGDSLAWQVVKPSRPNIMFIKPLEENAQTNMSVITTKRIYTFALSAKKATSQESNDLTFRLKFKYPEETAAQLAYIGGTSSANYNPLENVSAADLNFDYSYSGSKRLRPVRAFDDGTFTYLQFEQFDTLPAVFAVDSKKNERLVNFNVQGKYLVISGTNARFILRDGDTTTRVFNETYPKNDEVVKKPRPVAQIKEKKARLVNGVPLPEIKPRHNPLFSRLASLFSSDSKIDYKPASSLNLND